MKKSELRELIKSMLSEAVNVNRYNIPVTDENQLTPGETYMYKGNIKGEEVELEVILKYITPGGVYFNIIEPGKFNGRELSQNYMLFKDQPPVRPTIFKNSESVTEVMSPEQKLKDQLNCLSGLIGTDNIEYKDGTYTANINGKELKAIPGPTGFSCHFIVDYDGKKYNTNYMYGTIKTHGSDEVMYATQELKDALGL